LNKRRTLPVIEATLAVLVWGGSFVATKVALREVSPITVVWLRFGMGVVILGAVMLARRQFALPQGKDTAYFALLGFLGITFHQWLQSTGLVTSQASTTAWIVATTPVFMAVLGWLVLKERLTWLQGFGILLAAIGVMVIVTQGNWGFLLGGSFGAPGDLLVMLSAPNWAIFSILSRRGLQRTPATRMMFYVMGFGWLFSSLLFILGRGYQELSLLSLDGWSGIIFLGVFCSGLAYFFWYDALQALPASQAGAFVYLEPFVTVLVAAGMLGEAIRADAVMGGGANLLRVWMVNRFRS